MINLDKETKQMLLDIFRSKQIALEGNILKVIDIDDTDEEFNQYIHDAIDRDRDKRRKRLDIMKDIQARNRELTASETENNKLVGELTAAMQEINKAKEEAEKLRDAAVESLDTYQKKAQFELIGLIIRIALIVIIGVGVITSGMYMFAMVNQYDTKILESTWSNMFGILLTNSFSIIGTIMGVKYATNNINKKDE